MRCRTLFFLLILTTSTLAFIPLAHANPFTLTNPMYFKTAVSGAYIYFPSYVLPLTLSNWYFDGARNWFDNTLWITTTTTLTIASWFTNSWLNYTQAAGGTQQISNGVKPNKVILDTVLRSEGDGWSYSSGIVTVTGATISSCLCWGTQAVTGHIDQNQRVYYPIKVFVMNGSTPLSQVEVKIANLNDLVSIKYINKTDTNGVSIFYLEQGAYFAKVDLHAHSSTNATFTVPHDNYVVLNFVRPLQILGLTFDAPISFYIMIICIVALASFGVYWAVKHPEKWSRGMIR